MIELKHLNRNVVIISAAKELIEMARLEGLDQIDNRELVFLIDECDDSDLILEQLRKSIQTIIASYFDQNISEEEIVRFSMKCDLESHFKWDYHWFAYDLSINTLRHEYQSI